MSFTTQAVVGLNGTLTVSGAFPFATGETVELVVRPKTVAKTIPESTAPASLDDPTEGGKYPLRGTPYRYDNPFGCAWEDGEWETDS
jgi:hypothetical protein